MHWTSHTAVVSLLVALPNVCAAAQWDRDPAPNLPPGALRTHDALTDTTFVSSLGPDGNVRTTIRTGDFALEKVLAPSGELTLRLSQGKDLVTIAMSHDGYQVERNKRRARLDPRSDASEDRDAIRAILLGSSAVRTFRRLGAVLEDRDDSAGDNPLIVAALLDSALVHLLDGDLGASKRVGKRVTRHRRAVLKEAALRPDDGFRDCVLFYELSILNTWDMYWQCSASAENARWWVALWIESACELEWLLRSQQYIWQFSGCMMLPIA